MNAIRDCNQNNRIMKEEMKIPHIMNEHFASVGCRLAGITELLHSPGHDLEYLNKMWISNFIIFLSACNTQEV